MILLAVSLPEILLALIFVSVLSLAIATWAKVVKANQNGDAVEPYASRPAVPWGLVDLFGVTVIYVTLQFGALAICLGPDMKDGKGIEELGIPEQIPVMVMFAVASVLTVFVSVLFIRFRSGATLSDFGMVPRSWFPDFKSALTIFGLMIVPVLGIQFVLQKFSEEATHPLIKMLMESATPTFFIVSAVVAVIVAPLTEEFLFRVLLQGWLENLAMLFSGGKEKFAENERQLLILGGGDVAAVNATSEDGDEKDGFRPKPALWPIIVSSIVFALAHFGHGTDPIPLFFFALGLGWLYQRTHRMWPCVLVHMMLNGLSMLQLFLFLQLPNPPG